MRRATYRRVRPEVAEGWWAEVGYVGSLPLRFRWCNTKRGARWKARRMERRMGMAES